MKAKDTVMPHIRLETICNNWGQSIIPKDKDNNLPLSIAQAQAEISFNAGYEYARQQVLEWAEENQLIDLSELKKWGVAP